MAILKKLEKHLNDNKVKYKPFEHRKVFTAFDATQTQHLKTAQVAKAVLLKGKKTLFLAVLPAGRNCDFKACIKLAGEKVSMAKEKDIKDKLKTKVGLITPFGSLYNITVLLDKKLALNKKLTLPAGSYTDSIEISYKDYVKLENPILGSISIKK